MTPILRERLGEDAANSLRDYLDTYGDAWRADVVKACNERLDVRIELFAKREELIQGLSDVRHEMRDGFAQLRVEMGEGFARLRVEMADGFAQTRVEMAALRVELLRWSFAFWIGQVATTAGLMALLIRLLQP